MENLKLNSLLINSLQNSRIKNVLKLRKQRYRKEQNLFIVEGYREISRAVKQNIKISEIYYCPELWSENHIADEPLVKELIKNRVKHFQLKKNVFEKIAYRDRPDGLLALAEIWDLSFSSKEFEIRKDSIFIIAESIEKPGNLGTILRSADGAGVQAVLLTNKVTDIFNPNVVRASTACLFSTPLREAENITLINWIVDNSIMPVILTPEATLSYTEQKYNGPVAIIVGSEQYGLSEDWRKLDMKKIVIPMLGMADSLNVSTALGIVLYEVRRQKNKI